MSLCQPSVPCPAPVLAHPCASLCVCNTIQISTHCLPLVHAKCVARSPGHLPLPALPILTSPAPLPASAPFLALRLCRQGVRQDQLAHPDDRPSGWRHRLCREVHHAALCAGECRGGSSGAAGSSRSSTKSKWPAIRRHSGRSRTPFAAPRVRPCCRTPPHPPSCTITTTNTSTTKTTGGW